MELKTRWYFHGSVEGFKIISINPTIQARSKQDITKALRANGIDDSVSLVSLQTSEDGPSYIALLIRNHVSRTEWKQLKEATIYQWVEHVLNYFRERERT